MRIKFILLGVAGIILLIGCFFALRGCFLIAKKIGQTPRELWAMSSQHFINELVQNIEFYKIQHGAYPDSLEQLDRRNNFVSIHDPLFPGKKYNYQRIGERYRLFSAGIDRKPGTEDDLYPTVDMGNDSAGYLKRRE